MEAQRAVMEELVEDDICILNHEKADGAHKRDGEIPVPSYSGDESVASHFALVTAYEDIKKRLKETEKENSFLKKRVRILEEKMKENAESIKNLNEQLQSKEVELLQLRTEVETQQVIKNMNCTQSSWEIEKLNSDLKVHSLEQDIESLKQECNSLRKELQKAKQKDQAQEESQSNGDHLHRRDIQSVQQAYWELKREMSNLRLVTDIQAEVLRKLKTNPTVTKKAASTSPVQRVDLNISKPNLTPGVVYKKLSQNDQVFCNPVSPPLPRVGKTPSERVTLQAWTDERHVSVDSRMFQDHHSFGRSSLEDNSWVFPSPPKPNENVFWEIKNKTTLLNCPADYLDQCNQNCLHKS
ncbi:5-azacytidine-induced protein 2 isoform X4 [Apus apus]|uniref:5-azacytidine-induced protein 2 isoform X4 n=1 Tax=Apus apus TaxID=8895 RepID=UPI0021F8ABDD|nr:5-azacytidine-induced protein 2 isoform X4 [Apus apus]